jgi:alkaline phosphatase
MKNKLMVITVILALVVSYCYPALSSADVEGYHFWGPHFGKAKNIIFMVPDGLGLSNVTAARIFKNGPNGERLYLETLPQIGYQRTFAKNSTITDSAAAASAWASGEKYNNNEVSCHDENKDGFCDLPVAKTILELAKAKGKATGLVATSTITHATPAVWAAHVHFRNCETEISRQYIEVTGVDVLLGGGVGPDKSCLTPSPKTRDQIIAEAPAYGYTYVTSKADMNAAVDMGKKKIWGIFDPDHNGKTIEKFRVDPAIMYPAEEPTLPEMTAAALKVLEKDRDGFFLMVEGSQIDWANHANDLTYQVSETLAFDESVKVVLDWVNKHPSRLHNTLIIIVSDHGCAGFAVNGPYGSLTNAGELIQPGWTSRDHTGEDTLIWSQGPGSGYLGRALDNADLYQIMEKVLY